VYRGFWVMVFPLVGGVFMREIALLDVLVVPNLSSSSFWSKKCYYGPRTLPGLAILAQPMKSAADILVCFMAQQPINVPVLPRPALQCTATAPEFFFAKC